MKTLEAFIRFNVEQQIIHNRWRWKRSSAQRAGVGVAGAAGLGVPGREGSALRAINSGKASSALAPRTTLVV
jgi:hypothetical protein